MNKNPNCDGSHCRSEHGQVKLYPTGGDGNMILCRSCWAHENAYRRERGQETGAPENFPLLSWFHGKVYEVKAEMETMTLKGWFQFIKSIQDALGTAETGEALIEVARNAHKAEQKLAAFTCEIEKLAAEEETGEVEEVLIGEEPTPETWAEGYKIAQAQETARKFKETANAPYPWCLHPEICCSAGRCDRDPNCGN